MGVARWWLVLLIGAAPITLLALAAVVVAIASVFARDPARRAHCLRLVRALLAPLTSARNDLTRAVDRSG